MKKKKKTTFSRFVRSSEIVVFERKMCGKFVKKTYPRKSLTRRFSCRQVLHDRAQPPGLYIPVQRGQIADTHLAGVVRGHGTAVAVPARGGSARGPDAAVRGVRRAVAVARGSEGVHRLSGRRPIRVAVHDHIADPHEDIVLPDGAPQTSCRPFQRDKLQTR